MAVTIKQISEASGVSRGTVDRVLNGRGRVSGATREHVLAVARQMGYTPNLAGKALAARKKSYSIGVVLAAQGNPFFDEVIEGIREAERELDEYGVKVELQLLRGYDPKTQRDALLHLRTETSAMVLNPIAVPAIARAINETIGCGVPVVTLNTDIENTDRLCYVGSNYTSSGATACGMLALALPQGGPVLVFSGSREVLGHRQRAEGFVAEAQRRCPTLKIIHTAYIQDEDELAYKTALELLEQNPGIRGIYIATAGTAAICRAVQEKGSSGSIRIVCSDVVPATRGLIQQGVISAAIGQQPFQQGYTAVQRAFNHLLTGQPQTNWIAQNQISILQNLPE